MLAVITELETGCERTPRGAEELRKACLQISLLWVVIVGGVKLTEVGHSIKRNRKPGRCTWRFIFFQ